MGGKELLHSPQIFFLSFHKLPVPSCQFWDNCISDSATDAHLKKRCCLVHSQPKNSKQALHDSTDNDSKVCLSGRLLVSLQHPGKWINCWPWLGQCNQSMSEVWRTDERNSILATHLKRVAVLSLVTQQRKLVSTVYIQFRISSRWEEF